MRPKPSPSAPRCGIGKWRCEFLTLPWRGIIYLKPNRANHRPNDALPSNNLLPSRPIGRPRIGRFVVVVGPPRDELCKFLADSTPPIRPSRPAYDQGRCCLHHTARCALRHVTDPHLHWSGNSYRDLRGCIWRAIQDAESSKTTATPRTIGTQAHRPACFHRTQSYIQRPPQCGIPHMAGSFSRPFVRGCLPNVPFPLHSP
jgi:hypothetical protein